MGLSSGRRQDDDELQDLPRWPPASPSEGSEAPAGSGGARDGQLRRRGDDEEELGLDDEAEYDGVDGGDGDDETVGLDDADAGEVAAGDADLPIDPTRDEEESASFRDDGDGLGHEPAADEHDLDVDTDESGGWVGADAEGLADDDDEDGARDLEDEAAATALADGGEEGLDDEGCPAPGAGGAHRGRRSPGPDADDDAAGLPPLDRQDAADVGEDRDDGLEDPGLVETAIPGALDENDEEQHGPVGAGPSREGPSTRDPEAPAVRLALLGPTPAAAVTAVVRAGATVFAAGPQGVYRARGAPGALGFDEDAARQAGRALSEVDGDPVLPTSIAVTAEGCVAVATRLDGVRVSIDGRGPLGPAGEWPRAFRGPRMAVHVAADGPHLLVWTRCGALYCSPDRGRSWVGPLLEGPVRALSTGGALGGPITALVGGPGPTQLMTLLPADAVDGPRARTPATDALSAATHDLSFAASRWSARPAPSPPADCSGDVVLARLGDVVALAYEGDTEGVRLSVDGGATYSTLSALVGVTALALVPEGEGTALYAARHEPCSDRSVVVRVAVVGAHGARQAGKVVTVVDVARVLGRLGRIGSEDGEDGTRVHALVATPVVPPGAGAAAGRGPETELLVATGAGLLVARVAPPSAASHGAGPPDASPANARSDQAARTAAGNRGGAPEGEGSRRAEADVRHAGRAAPQCVPHVGPAPFSTAPSAPGRPFERGRVSSTTLGGARWMRRSG